MKGIITIFSMPQELEDLAQSLERLKRNSVYLDGSINYKVDITMCVSNELTDWENTKLPKEYFMERAKELCEKYLDWCEWDLLTESEEVLGCVSQRRYSLQNNTDADFFIWLDTDMFFKDTTLFYTQEVFKSILENDIKLFVITPEFVKQWDNSWDVIVNEKYKALSANYHLTADIYKEVLSDIGEIKIIQQPYLKFAGGWFTLITKSLLDETGIPDSFGHYGLEDTFVMHCSEIMKQNGETVFQFTIQNLIAGEIHKARTNQTIKKFIKSKDRKEEFRKIAESNFGIELQKFSQKN